MASCSGAGSSAPYYYTDYDQTNVSQSAQKDTYYIYDGEYVGADINNNHIYKLKAQGMSNNTYLGRFVSGQVVNGCVFVPVNHVAAAQGKDVPLFVQSDVDKKDDKFFGKSIHIIECLFKAKKGNALQDALKEYPKLVAQQDVKSGKHRELLSQALRTENLEQVNILINLYLNFFPKKSFAFTPGDGSENEKFVTELGKFLTNKVNGKFVHPELLKSAVTQDSPLYKITRNIRQELQKAHEQMSKQTVLPGETPKQKVDDGISFQAIIDGISSFLFSRPKNSTTVTIPPSNGKAEVLDNGQAPLQKLGN